MRNIKMEVKGDNLIITCNLKEKGEVSKSGKSMTIATTLGNQPVPGKPDVKLGLNLYRPK